MKVNGRQSNELSMLLPKRFVYFLTDSLVPCCASHNSPTLETHFLTSLAFHLDSGLSRVDQLLIESNDNQIKWRHSLINAIRVGVSHAVA